MNRRLSLLGKYVLFFLIWSPHISEAAEGTNVLFILTDNQAASLLSVYGNPDIRTPNIHELAKEGVTFTNAFAVNGMCSPTRATLMTGLMPSQHGLHNWLDDRLMKQWPDDWSAVAEFRTLPLTLRNRGYNTALIGKWHLGQPWKPSIGYEHWVTFDKGHTTDFWDNTIIDNQNTYQVKGQHIVDFFTDKAVEYIENYDGKKPFYLQLNYDGPYLNPPTNLGPARNRHYESYVGGEFKSFPRVAFSSNLIDQLLDDENRNPFVTWAIRSAVQQHNDPETMANVASQNTIVDDGVGRVLEALKNKGLDENTLVIFSSDQGNLYGQHGLWQHIVTTLPSNLYEAALNIPLIIRHPTKIPVNRRSDLLIGQYDLPVTILDYLDIDVVFEDSPGRSFIGALTGDGVDDWHDAIYYEQEESRGVRTNRYAYWKRLTTTGENEFYDMQNDPDQNYNLYGDPRYDQVIVELDDKLTEFYNEYVDPKYDLWNGGVAKGSVLRPETFQRIYGEQWHPHTEILPLFTE